MFSSARPTPQSLHIVTVSDKTPPTPMTPYSARLVSTNAYIDHFKITEFTPPKLLIALLALTIGPFSAVYTMPVAQALLRRLGLNNSIVIDVLGGAALFSNSVGNTQQLYESLLHLYEQSKHSPKIRKKDAKYINKLIVSVLGASSGTGILIYIAAEQLKTDYPHYIPLALSTGLATFAEFYLGGGELYKMLFQQVPSALSKIRPRRAANTEESSLLPLSNNTHPSYSATDNTSDTSTTQLSAGLEAVFTKLSTALLNLTASEKNTLIHFCDQLYKQARTDFKKNPGLFFSLLIHEKVAKNHPLLTENTWHSRDEIDSLLKDEGNSALIKKLQVEIDHLVLSLPSDFFSRLRQSIIMGLILFTCFSYLWDTCINLIKLLHHVPAAVALTLLGTPGIMMMFSLGVNLYEAYAKKWANLSAADRSDFSRVTHAKIVASIMIGLIAALLEASLCAEVAGEIVSLSWCFAAMGLLTKGFMNSPFTYRFIDGVHYTTSSAINSCLRCLSKQSDKITPPKNIIEEIAQYADLLAKNAHAFPYTTLAEWHESLVPVMDNASKEALNTAININTTPETDTEECPTPVFMGKNRHIF